MNFEEYKKKGIVSVLQKTEKARYIEFHKDAYFDDLKVADNLYIISPRWTIIAGYYAMHDVSKLYLAKQHDLKITERGVHLAVIVTLKHVLLDQEVKEKAIFLLTKAKETYDIFSTPIKEKIIPVLLSKGKDEREKSQYYSENYEKLVLRKSMEFQEKIVKPYIELMESMLKDDI